MISLAQFTQPYCHTSRAKLALVIRTGSLTLYFTALPLIAAIQGNVINATTGKPAPDISVTLIKFGGNQGMTPSDEIYTGVNGNFSFDNEVLDSGSQSVHAMLQVEYAGITYNTMLAPDSSPDNLEIKVYDIAVGETLTPKMTAFLFEPTQSRLVVNQFFQFSNESIPPRTFSDPVNGTLRFDLPPAVQGKVDVRTTGPVGMPLRSSARKIDNGNTYVVNYPLKPGDSLVELTYSLPYESGEPYFGRLLYPGLETRFVVPKDVTLESDDLELIGHEPRSQASIYQYNGAPEFSLRLRGQGQLSENTAGGSSADGSTEVIISPAPIARELPWIFSITGIILTLGFFNLLVPKTILQSNISIADRRTSSTDSAVTTLSNDAPKRQSLSRAARRRR